jgi:phosphoenolpyruvate carboxykinase (GTP)
MIQRVTGQAGGAEHLFGTSPRYDDLHWNGLAFTREQFDQVIGIDPTAWRDELALHGELFAMLAHHMPARLQATRERLQAQLRA